MPGNHQLKANQTELILEDWVIISRINQDLRVSSKSTTEVARLKPTEKSPATVNSFYRS